MGKFVAGNGQYVVYARDQQEARQIIGQELKRFDAIKDKIASLLSKDGTALQNFLQNTSEENLNIHFNDNESLIYDQPGTETTKGEVTHQRNADRSPVMDSQGNYKYQLAYRYQDIQGHKADFRLAHEMGHLMLNPSNVRMQTLDRDSNTRHVSGFIRQTADGQFYGEQMQENAINLIAQLAIRGEHSADDIIKGNADVSEFNSYKRSDDLVKLLAVAMRNDYSKQISFEQLMEQKIDSMIEHSDGKTEPANTFFYGMLNDTSMIQKDFDKYMGDGAWRDLDTFFTYLQDPNISQDKFEMLYQEAQGMIMDFANARMQDKYKEAVARDGSDVPLLEEKISMLNEVAGIEQVQEQQPISMEPEMEFPEGYSINEFREIIRPGRTDVQLDKNVQVNDNQLSLKQKIAQFLQRSIVLMNVPFVEKFVNRQLNVLPPPTVQRTSNVNSSRESFVNWLSNNGEYRKLPPIQRMSDPERMAQMQRRMQQNQQSTDENERF